MNDPFFSTNTGKKLLETSEIIFVSDLFVEDYVGGAELTTQALIDECPVSYEKLRSSEVTMELLESGKDKFWIFGNFAALDKNLIPSIIANLRYSILEYDYKFCKHRSCEKHFDVEKRPCDCHNELVGKIVSSFYYGATSLWWMSEKQREKYFTLFPFLAEKDNYVLSSVFNKETLGTLTHLNAISPKKEERSKWIVLGSDSWIKGADSAESWCKANNKDYEIVWNLPYKELLEKLAAAKGLVYLPKGGDTCPRMVIEAKLLGCELVLNDNVQHKDELWFNTDDIEDIKSYLFASPTFFWNCIKTIMEYKPKISGYTTTYNCIKQGYPIKQCIKSMLEFCDEVCVVDGGSTDTTLDSLAFIAYPDVKGARNEICLVEDIRGMIELSKASKETSYEFPDTFMNLKRNPRLKVKIIWRDWSHPRFAIFDGMQKAESRKMCTGDFCWQMDSDEIVHEDDAPKIIDMCKKFPNNVDIISLPVVEYWGGEDKVRVDVQPWKWRLSRNKPYITHGIPVDLRKFDDLGVYAAGGTDGCDMIHTETGERIEHVTFHNQQTENARRAALAGNEMALHAYENWFNQVIENIPGVFHYSWFDLKRKIVLYRDFWTKHWRSLENKTLDDTSETNMMFDIPWSEVTDEMIESRAKELKEKTGGWIFHQKWKGQFTPSIKVTRQQPQIMKIHYKI